MNKQIAMGNAPIGSGTLIQMPPLSVDAAEIVAGVMHTYAGRGMFQNCQIVKRKADVTDFHFNWLYGQPFTLSCDCKKSRLSLPDLLPRVEKNSLLYKELRTFLKARSDPGLPDHRRIDPERAMAASRFSAGIVSIELTLMDEDYEYAARKLINLAHELFLFLNEHWADYMWENFQLNME